MKRTLNYSLIRKQVENLGRRSVRNISTSVYAKFRCATLHIKKALGIFRELIPTTRRTTRVAFRVQKEPGPTFSKVPRKILSFHILGKSYERRHFRKDLKKDLRKIFRNALTLTQEINVQNNNERRIL